MSEAFAQRPVFDALERYLPTKTLISLVKLDRRLFELYKDDSLLWYRICNKNIDTAIRRGRLDVLQRIHKMHNKIMTNKRYTIIAIDWGQLEIAKWLHDISQKPDTIEIDIRHIAEKGHLEMIKWIYSEYSIKIESLGDSMNLAAKNGHIEVVKWLHENPRLYNSHSASYMAAENGHIEIVKYLHEKNNKSGFDLLTINRAINNGYFEIVKYLYETYRLKCSDRSYYEIMNKVLSSGNLQMMKYFDEKNPNELNTKLCVNLAIQNGHIELIKYLVTNRKKITFNQISLSGALDNGHVDVVKYLYKIYNKEVKSFCTKSFVQSHIENHRGHVEVVLWLEMILESINSTQSE